MCLSHIRVTGRLFSIIQGAYIKLLIHYYPEVPGFQNTVPTLYYCPSYIASRHHTALDSTKIHFEPTSFYKEI